MDVLNLNIQLPCLDSTLSFTDLKTKMFPKKHKHDRSIKISEERYTDKTLVGNWFERRAVHVPVPDDWKSIYDTDYQPPVNNTWKGNQVARWDNKLNLEGLPREQLLDYNGKECRDNMTTTYDLCYNILPKRSDGYGHRSYNSRFLKWIPEQDLTKCQGNLTQFGLREELRKELYWNSEEGMVERRWLSTYTEEIGLQTAEDYKRDAQFHKRLVDFNIPDLHHLERQRAELQSCLLPFKNPVKTNILGNKNK